MNFKLKALVAAAVTTMTMSGAANAINYNEMFLVASDASGTKTFIAALGNLTGSAKDFAGTAPLSANLAGTDWTNFLTGAVDVKYQVLGFSPAVLQSTSYNAADEFVLTSNNILGSFNNAAMTNIMADAGSPSGTIGQFLQNFNLAVTGSATKYVVGGGADGIGAVNTDVFSRFGGTDTTAALGTDLNFWNISRGTATNGAGQTVRTRFIGEGGNTTPDFWNLSAAGVLTYNTAGTAPIPEADTWAMMLLGLGFMGFVARRRQA